MAVVTGTKFTIDDAEIPNNAIAQYTFYGRGGGYGHLRIVNQQGQQLVDQIISLGPNDTFANAVVTGHFDLLSGGLTVYLGYSGSCDCNFSSGGKITCDTSKIMTPDERFIASMIYAAYDVQGGGHDYDDAVVSITFTKK